MPGAFGPWLFTCCGLNKQVNNARMFEVIRRYFAAKPGDTRAVLPFKRL